MLSVLSLECETEGEGGIIIGQFPKYGEEVNQMTKIILYMGYIEDLVD